MGGGHVFVLPPATRSVMLGKQRPTKIDARCANCGFEKWFPPHTRSAHPRGHRPERIMIHATAPRTSTRAVIPDVPAIADPVSRSMELLLRALTYARGGSWSLFERLAGQVGEEPWFALEAARTLASLGHVDLSIDLTTGRPKQWSIGPPVLCLTAAGAALSGGRSDGLIARLVEDAAALGGEVDVIDGDSAPATILVRDLDADELVEVARSLSDACGMEVVVGAGASSIAAALPSLAEVEQRLPQLNWPAVGIERFDLDENKWVTAAALDSPGAYKFITRPLRYGFLPSATGGLVCADNRLVKWLAARVSNRNLLAYDADHQLLFTRLGAQLPGLYERAAVLCTGRAPVRRVDGTVAYTGVSPQIATLLYRLLCE
jgi:hypothetical protein